MKSNFKIIEHMDLPEEVEELLYQDRELEYKLLVKRILPWRAINTKECSGLLKQRVKIISRLLESYPIAIQSCQPPCFTEAELGKICLANWTLYIPRKRENIEIKAITDDGFEAFGVVSLKDIQNILTIALDGFNVEIFLVKSLEPRLELLRMPHAQELLKKIIEEEIKKTLHT